MIFIINFFYFQRCIFFPRLFHSLSAIGECAKEDKRGRRRSIEKVRSEFEPCRRRCGMKISAVR
jgi:hypothetical protein